MCASGARRCASWLPRKALQFGLVVCQRPSTSVGTIARATPSHWQVRRLHGARPSPDGAARLSARSARVAARGGCAGGAAVGGRGASAGGLACSVRGVARLGGGVEARRAPRRRRDPRPGLRRCPGWLFVRRQTRGRPRRSRNEVDAGGRRGRAGGLQRGA